MSKFPTILISRATMTKTEKPLRLPPHTDPLWDDPDWRTRQLTKILDRKILTAQECADILGRERQTIHNYRQGKIHIIPRPALMALLLQINALRDACE